MLAPLFTVYNNLQYSTGRFKEANAMMVILTECHSKMRGVANSGQWDELEQRSSSPTGSQLDIARDRAVVKGGFGVK
jgi:hypothetical protein